MKITKYGHCCLLIEDGGIRILTDPGNYSESQREAREVDIILITHEHSDHLHLDSLKEVLGNNPKAKVVTNKGVGKILDEANIPYELLEHGESRDMLGAKFEGHGEKHALVYPGVEEVINTGFFINDTLFYPGDAFYDPKKRAKVLALPVGGPWVKIQEAIDYAKAMKPEIAFPVHDGMLKIKGGAHAHPQRFLTPEKINFRVIAEGEAADF